MYIEIKEWRKNMYEVSFPHLGINIDLNPIAFQIGSLSVYWYGIIIAAGFLLAALYAIKSAKNFNLNSDHLFDAIIVGLIAGVIGARLYYVLFYPGDKYIENPLEIFNIRDGGLGIYGGIIAGLGAGMLIAKIRKMSVLATLDIGCLGFLIGQGVGRWANFINQEAFGDATDLPWGMISERTIVNGEMTTVHPCFLYESILCFIGFALLHYFTKHFRRYDGQTALLYAIWYGMSRFFIEALRTDSLYIPFINIKVSQAVALISVVVAIALLVALRRRTVLSGCGNKVIMELNSVVIGQAKVNTDEIPTESTVFQGEKYVASTEQATDLIDKVEDEKETDED